MIFYGIYKSKIGNIYIKANEHTLIGVGFDDSQIKENENSIVKDTKNQLDEYFNNKRQVFNLPINPIGTDFQKKVWAELLKIPYGQTASYREIAVKIGNPKASRAVGSANNKNPIAIIIPCHRVIGANKKLTGYAGGLDKKQMLLDLEMNLLF